MTREGAIKVFGQLLEAFDQSEHGDYFYDFGDMVCEAANVAIAALREQESRAKKTSDKKTSEWISVEERLPENEKPVLAYYGFDNDGDGDLGMMFIGTLSYFCFDHDPHWQHAGCNLVVTHWMPLPEPPEVEG